MEALVVLWSILLVSRYFQHSLVSIILSLISSVIFTWLFSQRYYDSFYVYSLMYIFSYLVLLFGAVSFICLSLYLTAFSFGALSTGIDGCLDSDSYALSSLESIDCKYCDQNELIETDCLLLDYLYCLQELFWMLAASILDGIEASGLLSPYMQVLFIFSLLRIIFPTLFFVVSAGISFDFSLFSLSFFHKFSNILRSVSLNEYGSVFISSISITFVLEGQQICLYLLELNASLGVDCFSGRLFLGAVLEGIFLADLGLDFGSEVIDFLADCGFSAWVTTSNLIFFALFPLSSSDGATFGCLSGAFLCGRYSMPHFSLTIASTAAVSFVIFCLPSLASSLYCCNSFIMRSSHMSSCPLRWGSCSGGVLSRTLAPSFSAEVLPNFLKW